MSTEYIGGIALIGDPGSGKTAIGIELAGALDWWRTSFANALKREVADGLSHHGNGLPQIVASTSLHLIRMADPLTKDAYRPLLQTWGSFRRAADSFYWVDKALQGMDTTSAYVIDDCRYFNEYEALRARGFKFIYLQRGPTTRALPAEQAAHESEQDWHRFKTDIVLTYEPGPKHQAERIIRMLKLNGDIDNDMVDAVLDGAQRALDAATKGLAGVVSPGPDDTVDNTLFTLDHGPMTKLVVSFDPPYVGNIHYAIHDLVDEESVAWPI